MSLSYGKFVTERTTEEEEQSEKKPLVFVCGGDAAATPCFDDDHRPVRLKTKSSC